jgi:hypothetical protein
VPRKMINIVHLVWLIPATSSVVAGTWMIVAGMSVVSAVLNAALSAIYVTTLTYSAVLVVRLLDVRRTRARRHE